MQVPERHGGGLQGAAFVRMAACFACLGAAAIHFSTSGEHGALFGVAFVAMGVFQASWALLAGLRPSTALWWIGLAGNAGIVAVWLTAHTSGLPFGPGAGEPEATGVKDLIATGLELVAIAAAFALLHTNAAARLSSLRLPAGSSAAAAVVATALTGAAVATPHAHGPHADGDHGHGTETAAAHPHAGAGGHAGAGHAEAGDAHGAADPTGKVGGHSGGSGSGGHRHGGGTAGGAHGSAGHSRAMSTLAGGHGHAGAIGVDTGGHDHAGGGAKSRHSRGHDSGGSRDGHDHGRGSSGRDSGGSGGDRHDHGNAEGPQTAHADHGDGHGEADEPRETSVSIEAGSAGDEGRPGRAPAIVLRGQGNPETNGTHTHTDPGCRPTDDQAAAADRLHRQTVEALKRYENAPQRAFADGFYYAFGPTDRTMHMVNPDRMRNPTILDAGQIESFLYAWTDRGLVPIGGMYIMPKYGMRGPEIGGCRTKWHHHGGLGGRLASAGSMEETPEMLHVWTYPGLDPYSHYGGREIAQLWAPGKYTPSVCREFGDANDVCLP